MHTKEQLLEMKSEHDEWQNRIKFYRDEIKQFNQHLGKFAQPGAPKELMASVEHFQNQFIRQTEVLDIIRHDFKQHENLIEALEVPAITEPNEGIQKIHSTQREKLDQFEKIFHELRGEFNIFLNNVR
ncbi:MAG: hypothetical protein ABI772_01855 [Bacteroidota bacterium]